jgi:hypothetical protein
MSAESAPATSFGFQAKEQSWKETQSSWPQKIQRGEAATKGTGSNQQSNCHKKLYEVWRVA